MKRGRPQKPPHERLSVALDFRVTPEEADRVYRAALREKKPVTKFLREKLRQVFNTLPPPSQLKHP
jgi:predicted HicB family RNase H-like nuclease